jgi:two-component system response regulator DesR
LLQRNDIARWRGDAVMLGGRGMGRLRVLIADDNDTVRAAVGRLLEDRFELVGAVSNGRELVDAALAHRPDVIVSDLAMPSLDGLAALKVLRDAGDTTPFVLLTALVGDVRDWIDMGVIGVVLKSDLLDLVAAVESAAAGQIYLSRTLSEM